MGKYLKDWEAAKKTFAADSKQWLAAGGDGISADLKKEIGFLLTADTGLTPTLKAVDDAFTKKHRKSVMDALTKVHAVVEKVAPALVKIGGHFFSASSDAQKKKNIKLSNVLSELSMVIGTLNKALKNLETDISKGLETLQEKKSPDGLKITINPLEGDMLAAITRFKQAIAPFAALEKTHKVLTQIEPASKAMHAYSKSAARTDVPGALVAIETYFKAVEKIDTSCGKLASAKPAPDKKYIAAVDTLREALRKIKDNRGKVSHQELKKMEAAMKAK